MSSQRLESSLDAGQHKRKTSVASRKLSARMDSEISDAFRLFDKVRNWFALQLQFSSGENSILCKYYAKQLCKNWKIPNMFLCMMSDARFARVNHFCKVRTS